MHSFKEDRKNNNKIYKKLKEEIKRGKGKLTIQKPKV